MKISAGRVWAVARKEFIHIVRDPRTLYLSLVMPVVMLFVLGYAINFDIDNIKIGVVDQDRSPASRELVARLGAGSYFEIAARADETVSVLKLVETGKLRGVVVIQADFQKDLKRSRPARVQVLFDGGNSTTATIASAYLEGIVQAYAADTALRGARPGQPAIAVETRFLYNPELESKRFSLPGLLVVILAIIGTLLTTLTIAREWERGTMEQLLATPVRPLEIMLGKTIPYMAIGLVQTVTALVVIVQVFGVTLAGNPVFLLVYAMIFQTSIVALGILISAVVRQQTLAMQVGMVVAFLPNFLLSGFVFPIDSMPFLIQVLTYIIPGKYFLVIMRDIFLKGMVWHLVPALALSAFTFLLLVLAAKKTGKEIR